ncbi:Deoxyribose-phosphate aldolase 1 [Polaribacter huanghezhanensis]|uniref:deoxyribose-phosphate aldolase n=1 Tax=Polaribacter huanghezhanensis TaxID=1354726 RepID=UPI0026490BAF|nr:deoxyribose-phosphate aldolase [Polaribacter huanghezhanensis]WKD85649.1 Deoxyribose-phosphate aldolase 1 [Polaribacter huanghezhanensis]
MKLAQYLDSTYLKTPTQAGISEEETTANVIQLVEEAIAFNFKLVMLRANYISLAKEMINKASSGILVGTVIGFHEGTYSVEKKLIEAQKAIDLGADDLDFVVNYEAFKKGEISLIKEEVAKGTALGLQNNKVVKWIIEVAALNNKEIATISMLIKNVVIDNFGKENAKNVFVKSSTGFYKTENDKPNGATFESIKIMSENAKPLKIKAAGGVKTKNDALKMITLGVERIGTSSAKEIIEETTINSEY